MNKAIIVVDIQNDFVTGALGNEEAVKIIPAVVCKLKQAAAGGTDLIFTRDTHTADYADTNEGRHLPVPHCIKDTAGWEIIDELKSFADTAKKILDKPTFGSLALAEYMASQNYDEIELIGLCTDICVVSNALLLKARLPEICIAVDPACCAGVTVESHLAAIETMRMCQVDIR